MDAFVGEIRIFASTFNPRDWALCHGQLLNIAAYPALYSVIGTNFGGDGVTNFALPDLRGKVPMHAGSGIGLTPRTFADNVGTSTVTLLESQMPAHSHVTMGQSNTGNATSPGGNVWAKTTISRVNKNFYATGNTTSMDAGAVDLSGGGQPHNNMQPYITMNYIIALEGNYPLRP